MQPIWLSLSGLRPWKTDPPTLIAFSGGRPIVIGGEGPVDAASIRRAIAYALHGQTPCGDRGLRTLMDDQSPRMYAKLIFWAHGNAWGVTRTITRRPTGAVVKTRCILWRIGERTLVRGVRRVNRRLHELLACDSDDAERRPRGATRCPSPTGSPRGGDAHDGAASTDGDLALLCECMAAVSREMAAERKDAALLADAKAAAALATARHRQTQAALVEHRAALQKTRVRKAAALARLRAARLRWELWWR